MKTDEYLFSKLVEECCELGQRAIKAQIFGPREIQDAAREADLKQQAQPLDNLQRLYGEFCDVLGIMSMLNEIHHFMDDDDDIHRRINIKKERVLKYMEYSRSIGILQ